MLKEIDRKFTYLEDRVAYLGEIFLIVIMLLTTGNVIGRYLLNSPIQGVIEVISQFLLVGVTFIALAKAHREGAHVAVTVFVSRAPERLRRSILVLGNLVTAIVFVFLATRVWKLMFDAMEAGTTAAGFPTWWSWLMILFGCIMLVIRLVLQVVLTLLTGADTIEDMGQEDPSMEIAEEV